MRKLKQGEAPGWIGRELKDLCGLETPAFKARVTRYKKLRDEAGAAEAKMRALCPHAAQHVAIHYYASTDTLGNMRGGHYFATCELCGKRLQEWET